MLGYRERASFPESDFCCLVKKKWSTFSGIHNFFVLKSTQVWPFKKNRERKLSWFPWLSEQFIRNTVFEFCMKRLEILPLLWNRIGHSRTRPCGHNLHQQKINSVNKFVSNGWQAFIFADPRFTTDIGNAYLSPPLHIWWCNQDHVGSRANEINIKKLNSTLTVRSIYSILFPKN